MMFGNRGPWLGQVRLVRRPTMGNIADNFPTPPADAKSPANGCLFVGGRSIMNMAAIDAKIKDFQAMGYTDIQELDVPPPCDPAKDPYCVVGGNPPFKYVWACPSRLAPTGASQPASGTPVAAPATAPGTAPAAGPSMALVVGGGLAAAGLLAFLAFR